ncbi:MAG: transglycosylase SLT domain-containing protein [Synergistaceae bacterium]|nr:transglycosylase SLT domain-containing protein [Synergistaceae bacterium]
MTEIRIAKIVAAVIIICTVKMAFGADKITELFMKYNPKQAAEITEIVYDAGKKYGVDPNVIAAIIVRESGVRPRVISKGGDYGLMRVRWKVHRDKVRNAAELLNPRTNIYVGTRIFAEYYRRQKSLRGALLRYSGGNKTLADRVLRTLKNDL